MREKEIVTLDEFREHINKGFHLKTLKSILKAMEIEPIEYGCVQSLHKYNYSDIMDAFLSMEKDDNIENGEVVYILKIYKDDVFTGKVKIGITENIKSRLLSLNSECREYGVSFRVYLLTNPTLKSMDIEKSIHIILKEKKMQYFPAIKFNGYTEVFEYEEWIDNLISSNSNGGS